MDTNELNGLFEYMYQMYKELDEIQRNEYMVSLQDICPAYDIDFNDPFEVAQLGPGLRSDTVKPLRF